MHRCGEIVGSCVLPGLSLIDWTGRGHARGLPVVPRARNKTLSHYLSHYVGKYVLHGLPFIYAEVQVRGRGTGGRRWCVTIRFGRATPNRARGRHPPRAAPARAPEAAAAARGRGARRSLHSAARNQSTWPPARTKKAPGSMSSNWDKLQKKLKPSLQPEKKLKREHNAATGTAAAAAATSSNAPGAAAAAAASASTAPASMRVAAPSIPADPIASNSAASTRVALDCEMVGVGQGGKRSALAQVIVVSFDERIVYSAFVKPPEPVTDFRTELSGVRPEHMQRALPLRRVQTEVAELLRDRIVIGHGLANDFKARSPRRSLPAQPSCRLAPPSHPPLTRVLRQAMMLGHPKEATRDTALFPPCAESSCFLRQLPQTRAWLITLPICARAGTDASLNSARGRASCAGSRSSISGGTFRAVRSRRAEHHTCARTVYAMLHRQSPAELHRGRTLSDQAPTIRRRTRVRRCASTSSR